MDYEARREQEAAKVESALWIRARHAEALRINEDIDMLRRAERVLLVSYTEDER